MKNIIFWPVVIVIISIVVWLLLRKKTSATVTGSSTVSKSSFPLKKGSKGKEVETLQRWLNSKTRPPVAQLTSDGVFGPLTEILLVSITGKNTVTYNEFIQLKQDTL